MCIIPKSVYTYVPAVKQRCPFLSRPNETNNKRVGGFYRPTLERKEKAALEAAMRLPKVPSVPSNSLFLPFGTPPRIAKVHIQPSVPVYIKKNTIVSILGKTPNNIFSNIKTSIYLLEPFRRLLLGGHTSNYQKLESTIPIEVLFSSGKNYAALQLDGTFDWAILDPTALEGFSGDHLRITTKILPSVISEKLRTRYVKNEKLFGGLLTRKVDGIPENTSTGLFSYSRAGYTLVTGRGEIAVSGQGEVYKVELEEDDEILIKKNNIVAISVDGELSDCAVGQIIKTEFDDEIVKSNELIPDADTAIEVSKKARLVEAKNSVLSFVDSSVSTIQRSLAKLSVSIFGDGGYVKVVGPRTLLLQTSSKRTNERIQAPSPPDFDKITSPEKIEQ